MVLYVSHSCGFLSTWSVVNFTMERYINVFHPLRRDMFCTKRRANLIVVSLVVFACLVYTYTIFSYGAVDYGHLSVCSPKPGHRNILQAMTAIDTFVSCVVPSTFIVVCNARLIRKLRHDNVEFSATTAGRDTSGTGPDATADTAAVSHPLAIYHPGSRDVSDTITPKSPKVGIHLSPAEVGSAAISSHSSNTRPSLVTVAGCHRMTRERCRLRKARMLLVLSSILVLLSLPSHVLRTQFTIRHLFGASHRMTRIETDLHEIFQLLYLLGFAVNFFIYSLCGHHFRRELRRTFGRCRYTMCKYKTRALRSRKRSTQNDEIYIQLERVS
ncbi:hypothetical protein LSAT2_019125 [Lamellibrachia satsuma]|nr:hypothetical protein LSAT2_019125 [Lamellibrachia satsuma]